MAIGFDNATDRLQSASPPSGSTWSIGLLFNPQTNLGAYAMLAALENSGATQYQEIGFNPSNQLALFDHSAGEIFQFGTVTLNAWYWIFLCVGSGSADVYFGAAGTNPSLSSLTGSIASITTPTTLKLASTSANEYFNGYMHGVKVWSGAKLTSAEVQAECADIQFVKTANRHALYPLWNDTLKLEDENGGGRVLTGSGGAWTNQTAPSIPYTGIIDGTTGLYFRTQNLITTETNRKRLAIGQASVNNNATKTSHGTTAVANWRGHTPIATNSTNAGTPPFSLANVGWKVDPIDMGATALRNRTIAAGTWTFTFNLLATIAQASALTTVRVEVWKLASGGATGTLLFSSSSAATQIGTGTTTVTWTTGSQSAVTFDAGETLHVEVFTEAPGVIVTGQTITSRLESAGGGSGPDAAVTIPALGNTQIVSPSIANVTITGYTPRVDQVVSGAVANVTITAYPPTVTQPGGGAQQVDPNRADVTLTGYAPAVEFVASPNRADVTITGYSPAVFQDQAIAANRADVALTAYAPALEQNIGGALAQVTLTAYAPAVLQDQLISANRADVALTGYQPAIEVTVSPARADVVLTGYAPAVLQDQSIAANRGDVAITGYSPAVLQDQAVAGALATVAITAYLPAVTQGGGAQQVDPSLATVAITAYAPAVLQDQSVAANRANVSITAFPPVVNQAQLIQVDRADVRITMGSHVVTTENTVNATRADVTLTGYAPAVTRTVQPLRGDVTLTGFAAAVTVGPVSITGALAIVGIVAPPPAVTVAPIYVDRGEVGIASYAPAVNFWNLITPDGGRVGVITPAPAVTIGAITLEPLLGVVSIVGFVPFVARGILPLRGEVSLQAFGFEVTRDALPPASIYDGVRDARSPYPGASFGHFRRTREKRYPSKG